jgi:hypothetical protein
MTSNSVSWFDQLRAMREAEGFWTPFAHHCERLGAKVP